MTAIIQSPEQLTQLSDEAKRELLIKLLQVAQHSPVLSVTQERIWQLDKIAPGNPIYNFQSAVALTGSLHYGALTQAVERIVERHDPLRTCYGSTLGKPKLEVLPRLAVPIDTIDWTVYSTDEQDTLLQEAATAAAQVSFTLDRPPLFRLQCFRMSTERHVLVLTMHHIVSDLLSLDLFFEEIGSNYGNVMAGSDANAAPLALTYQDHSRAEHAGRVALKQGTSAQFWREYLVDVPDLQWHSDFPRPPRPSGKASTVYFTLDADTVQAVIALARNERVTPFVVLLSAYYILQRAASGNDDQLVGVPTAGRSREELQSLIGMFSSPLPMRTTLTGQLAFRELLQRVRQTVLSVTEHSALPFADIVDLGQAGGKPLALRSMFSFVSKMKTIVFRGLEVERVPTDRGMSDFDLFLTLYQDGGSWRGVFEYSTDLFGSGTAIGWAEAYSAIVHNVIAEPMKTIAELGVPVLLPRVLQIAVAATFTADTLEETANFWQRELNWPTRMLFAPYNQVFQALMDSTSELRHEDNTLNVLLIRPEDWVRYNEDSELRLNTLSKLTGEFIDAVQQAMLRAPLVIYICPASTGTVDGEAISAAEIRIESELADLAGVTLLRSNALLARYGLTDVHDVQADQIGHIPFTRPWFVAMGTELVRRAASLQRPPVKVIALDCDNTLWRGICGEDGAKGVSVDGPFHFLQKFVAAQADDGVLLCLVSKNEPEDVFRVFDENDGMLLKRERIVGHRINWLPKSANLSALAAELQLGLDSFVFIDDNPVECAEVRAACPEVLTLCLPQEIDAIPAFLQHVWAFDRHQVSTEDRNRVDSYLQQSQREKLQQHTGSFGDFLAKLELQVDIVPAEGDNLLRLAQLSQRTNQFNNSGVRYDETGLRHALAGGLQALAISVRDRFGDYGLVGALCYRIVDSVLHIESFLLSCRVLGRGVEHRMLAELAGSASEHGFESVYIGFNKLPRNQPFRRFLTSLDGIFNEDGTAFVLTAAAAASTCFDPERYGVETLEKSAAPTASASDVQVVRQTALVNIADSLHSLDDILTRLDQGKRRVRTSSVNSPPQGDAERAIADIWQDVLRIDELGRDDSFFEVGGNSLLLVQVNSRLMEHFGKDIPITSLFQFPTITSLANHLCNSDAATDSRAKVQERGEQARQQLQQRMQRLAGMRRQ